MNILFYVTLSPNATIKPEWKYAGKPLPVVAIFGDTPSLLLVMPNMELVTCGIKSVTVHSKLSEVLG